MLRATIDWSARHPLPVLIAALLLAVAGIFALRATPVDAIPDLSDVQVIVYTDYPGQSPQVVENQLTYPLTSALLSVPQAKVVRGFSAFGVSFVYLIFEDGTDLYWARARVLEYLSQAAGRLPVGVTPQLGPDATGVGWVYQYALQSDRHNLGQLRAMQDWLLRYRLAETPGVAEVAAVGGFVPEYQVTVDPLRLRGYGVTLNEVAEAIRTANREVGGRVVAMAQAEYMVQSRGYLHGIDDLRAIVVKSVGGTPVHLGDVAQIALGPEERRGVADLDGEGEVVAGIAVARSGQNALSVIDGFKQRLQTVAASLPEGVRIETLYDRSLLIGRAITTLNRTLIEEAAIVALVCLLFLLHARSAMVAIAMLPLGVLLAFIAMYLLGIGANIMSLGGIAIAIGAMVDAAIVTIENAHKHLERLPTEAAEEERRQAILTAAREVGPSLFFSLLIVTISFLPVFALQAQEGRLFAPLAFTKSFAMAGAALLSVTLVPVLMLLFIRGRIRSEYENPLNRGLNEIYRPLLGYVLGHRRATLLLALAAMLATLYPAAKLGSEFMPTLNEGTLFYMPAAQPALSVGEAARLLQRQDRIIKSFPEVARVFGKAGRAQSATDPAPLEMFETTIELKPESEWRPGMTTDTLIAEMDAALRFPGIANSWTMPIKARIDMLATGIRTPVGIKLFGHDAAELQAAAQQVATAVRSVAGTASAYAEQSNGGLYLEIVPDRERLARYGLSIEAVQQTIAVALGGERLTTAVEGRQRFGVTLRYARELRADPEQIAREVSVATPGGAQIPLGEIAALRIAQAPPVIKSENGLLVAYVYVDTRADDLGGFVRRAQQAVQQQVVLPAGMTLAWSGQYEYLQRAAERLQIVVPATLLLILLLLWLNFRRIGESLLVLLSVPFALIGGVWLLWLLGYNLSVAVAVGFIALAGVAAETGVVMLLYLERAWQQKIELCRNEGRTPTAADLTAAVMAGAVERLRPKSMTVVAIIAGLLPVLWSSGAGSEVMRRIAAPMVGGMLTSAALTLLVIPLLYLLLRERALAVGTKNASHSKQ